MTSQKLAELQAADSWARAMELLVEDGILAFNSKHDSWQVVQQKRQQMKTSARSENSMSNDSKPGPFMVGKFRESVSFCACGKLHAGSHMLLTFVLLDRGPRLCQRGR